MLLARRFAIDAPRVATRRAYKYRLLLFKACQVCSFHHICEELSELQFKTMSKGSHYIALPMENHHRIVKEGKVESLLISPRALNIVWGNDRRFWKWTPLRNQEGPKPQDEAELLQVNWIHVTGRVDCSKISKFFDFPRSKTYEIFWVVKFNIDAFGWHNVPIKFKVASDGRCQQRTEKLEAYRRNNNQWHEIKGGEFTVVHGREGLIDIGMFETESDWWKGGMVLSEVKIKPKA